MTLRPSLGLARFRHRLARRLPCWRRDDGVAAVEFALVLPVMVTLYFGLSDLTPAIVIDRKLTILSRSLADLAARVSSLSCSDVGQIFDAASAIMRPHDPTTVQMVLTSVLVTVNGSTYTGKVDWSYGRNLQSRANGQSQADFDAINLKVRTANSTYAVPSAFQTSITRSFILVETLKPYKSTFGQYLVGTIQLRETMPWPVRNNDKVAGPGTCAA